MPLTLPPVSRRKFLATTIAAGVGLTLPSRWSFGEAQQPSIDRIALLSDTHIHANPKHVARDVNMADNLRKVVAQILAQDPLPAELFVNGDLAYSSGEAADYVTFLELIAPLREKGIPIHLGMGNHDHRQRLWAALPDNDPARQQLPDRQILLVEKPNADWLVLDSLDKPGVVPGALGQPQLDWLKSTLDARKADKPVIVMAHHHPKLTPDLPGKKFGGLLDSPALLEILLPRRQVKMLLFGHTHVWARAQLDGIHLVNLPASAYVFHKTQPSAHVDARIATSGALFTLRTLDSNHPRADEELRLDWRS